MHITLVAVTSLDGRLTYGNNTDQKWASKEDHDHLIKLIDQSNLLVMGRNTFEIVNSQPKEGKLKIVLTRNPTSYKDKTVNGLIEFSNESPNELVDRLEKLGYEKMLLVGGSEVYSLFLKSGLVDEIELTIEPFIFGSGVPFTKNVQLNKSLKLVKVTKLNQKGTILLNYTSK